MTSAPVSRAVVSVNHYASAARFYEIEHRQLELQGPGADVRGYVRRGVQGPVLVLACGTGRICRALEVSRSVTGLDASPEMLALASGRTRYVLGDMRQFELGTFAEVIVPNGGFCFLPTRRDQNQCLQSIHRALPVGAPLTLDLPMPDFLLLGIKHSPEAEGWRYEHDDGTTVRRTREVFRNAVAGELLLIDRYYVDDTLVASARLPLRLVFRNEAEWLLEANGFAVDELWGDHLDGPVRDGCPRLLVRALRL